MTTISGFIAGITSGAIPPEKHSYYLGIIQSEVLRLSRLVSEILDVSRLESGERKFTFTEFDIAEVSRLILISFEQKIEEKKLDVEFVSEDTVPVVADKDAIYQVMYNLCHNAIKFSKENGKFRIAISSDDNDIVRVSVFDEGQGIADEDLPYIFDRFYKTDKSRGLDKNGVGLGLYICKAIMDQHKMKIGATSTENSCEFYFELKKGLHQHPKGHISHWE
jgi:signal transduction histidine kinase